MGAGRGVGGVPEKKKEEEEYKPHLRAKLVNEIINTEKGYVSSLGIVKTVCFCFVFCLCFCFRFCLVSVVVIVNYFFRFSWCK